MPEPTATEKEIVIPPGILRAKAALLKDLPALLASRWTRGKWACYSGDGKVAIGKPFLPLIAEALRRGIPADEFIIERIEPGAGSDEEIEIESKWW